MLEKWGIVCYNLFINFTKDKIMNFLQQKILKDGIVREGNVLKVDSFLNHQMDVEVIDQIGKTFYERFKDKGITRIITIESSGIALGFATARYFNLPFVFAKKSKSINIDSDVYVAQVESFTHKCVNNVVVSKKFISPQDKVLIIDDFLANGCALQGLIQIVEQAGAVVAGIGIAIEKGFQDGGAIIRGKGYDLHSIAIVESMDSESKTVNFR